MSVFSAIGSFISGLFEPAAKLIDEVHTSSEEKLKLRNKFAEIQAVVNAKCIDYQTKMTELENGVRMAELKSNYWLAANWRPLTAMLLVVNTIVMAYLKIDIPDALSTLTYIFIPGYASLRSMDKRTKTLMSK